MNKKRYIELSPQEYSYIARCVLARPSVTPAYPDAVRVGAEDAVLRALDDGERYAVADTMEELEVLTFSDDMPADAVSQEVEGT